MSFCNEDHYGSMSSLCVLDKLYDANKKAYVGNKTDAQVFGKGVKYQLCMFLPPVSPKDEMTNKGVTK
eukprot:15365689-Ditylum_brightwellii.AAC.1